ncbi:MAG: tetratricopeptide repeat protein, partial [Nitrospiraceae bacterium]
GDIAALTGRDADARRAYLLLYNLYPLHRAVPSGLIVIGDTYRRSGRLERAHLFYATAVTQYPTTKAATVARMRLIELGQQIKAGTHEERIAPMIRESIHHTPPLIVDSTEQRETLRMIADANGETILGHEAKFHLGEHFEHAHHWAEAVQVYRDIHDRDGRVAGDPWPEAARRRLSAILEPWLVAALKAGDDWTALALFHRHGIFADRVYSGKAVLVHMAAVHRRLGFSAEAIKTYQSILKDPSAPSLHEEALIGLGESYFDQRDFPAARKVFERYRVQYPLGRYKLDALGLLARALQAQGTLPEAIRLSRQWLELSPAHPDRPRMWHRLASALSDHGEIASALKAYADAEREGALVLTEARLHYADLLARQQRPAEAAHHYQAVLGASPSPADAEWATIQLARLWRGQRGAPDADGLLHDVGRMTDDPWLARVVSALRVDLFHEPGQEGS